MAGFYKTIAAAVCCGVVFVLPASGGPPYLTDDPEPTDYHHFETYLFTLGETAHGTYNIQGPAYELNYGGFHDTQLSVTIPLTTIDGGGTSAVTGLGDMQLGVKYRFIHETNGWPQVSFYPIVFAPTGDSHRNLGNGQAFYQIPFWAQKSWGAWTTYGGGGVTLNPAPTQRHYPYGGWLLQRAITTNLSVGAEVFAQGRDAVSDHGFVALNAGAIYQFNENFSVLGSLGHSIYRDEHLFWYLAVGINW